MPGIILQEVNVLIQTVHTNQCKTNYIMSPIQQLPNPLDNLLKSLNIGPYNERTEADLLRQKEYAKLVAVQDCLDGSNQAYYVQKYLQTPAFRELAESKYFNSPHDFKKLTTIVSTLEQKKQNAIATVSSPYYRPVMIPDVLLFQANTNVCDCINNINKVFKSKFSDDLKIYIKDNTNLLTDLQKTSVNLGYLDMEKPDVAFLNNSMFALC